MKSEPEILTDLARYCSQAERSLFDVRKKIQVANLSEDVEKRVIDKLLREKFIDERRFARSFVHDKFHFNRWGRIKIVYELKLRGIPPDVYYEAIKTIDEDEYMAVLQEMLTAKKQTVRGRSSQDTYQKLCRFAAARGFEMPFIIKILKKILKNLVDD